MVAADVLTGIRFADAISHFVHYPDTISHRIDDVAAGLLA
jgi:hypothetical protein